MKPILSLSIIVILSLSLSLTKTQAVQNSNHPPEPNATQGLAELQKTPQFACESDSNSSKLNNHWQQIILQNAGTIFVPQEWSVIQKNMPPKQESSDGGSAFWQLLLEMRPKGYADGTSMFQVMATWGQNKNGADIPLSTTDIDTIDKGMAKAICDRLHIRETGDLERVNLTNRFARIRTYAIDTSAGIPKKIKLIMIQGGYRLYYLSMVYPKADEAYWNTTLQDILKKWELPPGKSRMDFGGDSFFSGEQVGQDTQIKIKWENLLLMLLLNWSIGLTPPIVLRYIVLRRPIHHRWLAIFIICILLLLNMIIFSALGGKNPGALILMAFVSYAILRMNKFGNKPATFQQSSCVK